MGLQKINWTQIDSANVPNNVIVDIGSENRPVRALYAENIYLTGASIGDLIINKGTFSGGTLTLTSNSGTTITISGLATTDTYTTGGTYNNNTITFYNNNNTTFSVTGITDYDVTGFTFNPSNYFLTVKRNGGLPDLTADLSILSSDLTITGGTYNAATGIATFTNNQGNSFNVYGFLTGATDTIITGVSFNDNVLSITQSNGTVSSVVINNFTGLTVNGIISGTTFYGNGSNLTNVQGILGVPEDGIYSDGLFTDITSGTTVGVFADRVNEILKSLAPSPAPILSEMNLTSSGTNGKMSYNSSASPSGYSSIDTIGNLNSVNFDGTYSLTTNRYGIFSSTLSTISGVLASNVSVGSGSPYPSYPANAFGDADQGILELYINDDNIPIHTVNLTSFVSGNTLNGNSSGFNLSAPTSVKFPLGNNLDLFKYRTGTWVITSTNIRNGWNFIKITHRIGVTVRTTQYIDFFKDSVTTNTTFSSESLGSLSLTGLKYLSGVKYSTGGSATYNVTVDNAYKNTYSSSLNAISYSNNSTNLIVPSSEALSTSGNDVTKSFSLIKNVSIVNSGIRILNGPITLKTTVLRTVQSTQTSAGATINGLLVDNVTVTSSATTENFDDEQYRLPSDLNFDDQSLVVTSSWNSTNSIANGGITGYNDGLLVYNGLLYYPNQVSTPNFSSITYSPASNVDYSGSNVTGGRTYYRFFTKSGAANFVLNVNGTGTIRSNSYSMTNGTNDIKIDIKLPNGGGLGTGWLDVSQLFATDQWSDGSGCLLSGTFAFNTNNNLTVGTRNTSNSGVGNKIIIRIRVPQNWTGSLNTITLT